MIVAIVTKLCTAFVLCFTVSAAYNDSSYAVFAPKMLRRGTEYKLSVRVLKSTGYVTISAELLDAMNNTVVQNVSTLSTGSTESLTLKIPHNLLDSSYQLRVSASGGLNFRKEVPVTVNSKELSVFVQTDKAMYKPGQKVLYRAIVVRPDLKPYKGPVNISIYDKDDNKIAQQLQLLNETGVFGGELSLSDQTPLGTWKIKVEARVNSIEKRFEVAEYVLPKFKVSIDLPSFYLINDNRPSGQPSLKFTVTAKYTYGQPVKGSSTVSVQILPYPWELEFARFNQHIFSASLSEGKFEVTMPIEDILKLWPSEHHHSDRWRSIAYRSLLIIANVTEAATGKTYSSNGTIQCRDQRYQLNFMDISPNSYKTGLIYTGYLQLSQVDGSQPLPSDVNSLITLTVTTYYPDRTRGTETHKFDIAVTETGLMSFVLTTALDGATSVNLQASFRDELTGNDISAYKYLVPFESRDNQSIQVSLATTEGVIRAGGTMNFNIKLTTPVAFCSYQVMSKGAIIINEVIISPSPSLHHEFQLTVSEALAQMLMPTARIVVWSITGAGEMISDSLEVNVVSSFANKVTLSFSEAQVEPGNKLTLTVKAYEGSYVGLLAVDQSVLLLKSGNDISQSMVFDDLEQYDSSTKFGGRNSRDWDMMDRRRRRRCALWPYFSGGSDTSEVFSNAGLIVITDAYVFSRKPYMRGRFYMLEDEVDAERMGAEPVMLEGRAMFKSVGAPKSSLAGQQTLITAQPRAEFPETWLWSDVSVSNNGSADITVTVPDTITSWVASAFAVSNEVGLGVASSNAKLTVFKPFFVSLNMPFSVIRGEEFALKVTLFNYLTTDAQVLVTLRKSDDFMVRHVNAVEPKEMELSEDVLVPANDAKTVYFWIVPQTLGQIPVEVHAQSTAAADAERRLLLVKPEGVSQEYSASVFVDLTKRNFFNTTLRVSLPPTGVVPGSQHVVLTVMGDLLGPSINGLDDLVKMPYGCGEQNMLNFAPNIYVLNYLTSTYMLTSQTAEKSKRYMTAGYQRELTYQRRDGSFSAFGNSDPAGSVWLSAFVAKCFHEAKDYIPIEQEKIAVTLDWIIGRQSGDGAFKEPPNGRVIHTDMQGGTSQGVALTAYVLIALLENNDTQQIETRRYNNAVIRARTYLENQLMSVSSDPYAVCIISYALVLSGSQRASSSIAMLKQLAISKDGLMHWEKASDETALKEPHRSWRPPYTQSRAVDIEMTSYALLTYALLKDVSGGIPIAKWIIAQRNSNGGFSSTQDTVMALQALALFASLTRTSSGTDSVLHVTADYGDSTHSFQPIAHENTLLLQSVEIPSTVEEVRVAAHGSGVAVVQLNAKYNKYEVEKKAGIILKVASHQVENTVSLVACGRWNNTEQSSGMVVMDISQLTGFSAVNIDELQQQVGNGLKRIDNDDNRIVLYFDELTGKETCLTVKSEKVHVVSNIQKAAVRLYSYYDPSSDDTEFYLPPEASAQTDLCTTCPQCCGLPEPQPIHRNTAPRLTSSLVNAATLTGILITFTVASLLSCLLVI